MTPYDECILFLLAKAYQRAHGQFRKQLQPHDLTPVQTLVIMALGAEEGACVGDLGKRLGLDYATLSGVLDRLAAAGWVVKETGDTDRRYLKIFLCPKARNILPVLVKIREAANAEIMKPLRTEERLLLKRMLRDLQG
jgi:DNA-binding MarR family transcriptional regulator